MKTYPSDDGNAAFVSLEPGEDLLAGLDRAVEALGIEAATVQAIGALERAVIGFLDPEDGQYQPLRTGHVELLSGLGNVSMRDGRPFVHLHLTLAGRDGTAMGGHAMEGCVAFVVEAYLRRLGGPAPERQDVPGMPLKVWPGA